MALESQLKTTETELQLAQARLAENNLSTGFMEDPSLASYSLKQQEENQMVMADPMVVSPPSSPDGAKVQPPPTYQPSSRPYAVEATRSINEAKGKPITPLKQPSLPLESQQAPAEAKPVAPAMVTTPPPIKHYDVEIDNLEQVNGIGPKYAERLRAAGIRTLGDLVSTPLAVLSEIVQVDYWQSQELEGWIAEARTLLGVE